MKRLCMLLMLLALLMAGCGKEETIQTEKVTISVMVPETTTPTETTQEIFQQETMGENIVEAMKQEVSCASELNSKLMGKLQTDGSMTQADINDNAQQRYELWDVVLNKLWGALEQSVDADAFEALKAEQLVWIEMKEAQAEDAAAPVAGGSLYPAAYYGRAAKLTEARVVILLGYLTGEQELPPAEIADAPDELVAGKSTIEDVSLYYQAENPLKDIYAVFRDFDGNGYGDLAVCRNASYLGIYFMDENYVVSNIVLFDEVEFAYLYEYWEPEEDPAEVVPNIIGTYEVENNGAVGIYTFYAIADNGSLYLRDSIKYDANGVENKWFAIEDAAWVPITEETHHEILGYYRFGAEDLKPIEEYYLR